MARRRLFLLHRLTAGTLGVALAALALGTTPAARADTRPISTTLPPTVSAEPLPTWQVNGVVWSQVVVGTTVYATGRFSTARPPGVGVGGVGEVAANNIFAYDITTGNRVTTFNHSLDAQGLAITASPDGKRVYVGGDFVTVDGQSRQHVAAFNTADGSLSTTFKPVANGQVKALSATDSTLYAGGAFQSAGGAARVRLAAFALTPATAATDGKLSTTWVPKADNGDVYALQVTPDKTKVVVGGQFSTINGAVVSGMGAVDATTGVSRPWAANAVIKDSGSGAIGSLTTDGTSIYGSGWAFGAGGRFEGSFSLNPADGTIRWLVDCQGDTYDVQPVGPVVYTVSHAHNCTMINGFGDTSPRTRWQRAGAFTAAATGTNKGPDMYGWNYSGQPAPTMLQWFPTMSPGSVSGQGQAAWSIATNGTYLTLGGEFPTVNGKPQQGLTRYVLPATATAAGNKVGPQYTDTVPVRSTAPATTVSVVTPGTIKVGYGAAWDMDNQRLTYQLYRDYGTASQALLRTHTVDSTFWTLPAQTFDDVVPAGTKHTYRVRVSDPFGNEVLSPVSKPADSAGNAAPVASFTTAVSGQTATFSGSGSSDPDGDVTGWAWSFGDGTTGTGSNVTHAYAAVGTYQVQLTVTDNQGAKGTVTKPVTITGAASTTLATDGFTRTVASGWGTADSGGTWTLNGTAADFSVGGGSGQLRLTNGVSRTARLPISSTDTDLQLTFTMDKAATGGQQMIQAIARGDQANGYQAKVAVSPANQGMTLYLGRVAANVETNLATAVVGGTFTPGTTYRVRVQAWGSGTTALRAKVWPASAVEPTAWLAQTADTTAALQTAGGIAVRGYLSTGSTIAPLTVSVSDLTAQRTGN